MGRRGCTQLPGVAWRLGRRGLRTRVSDAALDRRYVPVRYASVRRKADMSAALRGRLRLRIGTFSVPELLPDRGSAECREGSFTAGRRRRSSVRPRPPASCAQSARLVLPSPDFVHCTELAIRQLSVLWTLVRLPQGMALRTGQVSGEVVRANTLEKLTRMIGTSSCFFLFQNVS